MAKKDYYDLLGVQKGATDQEIKAAYKKKVMQFHPDRFATKSEAERKGAEDKFKEINHAYDILGDPQKKSNYDQFGSEDGGMGGFNGGGGTAGGNYTGGFGGFEDIINDLFGGMGGRRRTNPNRPIDGEDIVMRLELTFEEAVFGCEKQVKLYRSEKCKDCNGSGAKDPQSVKTCTRCGGSGVVTMTQQTIFGITQTQAVCPDCNGSGKIISDKCTTCKGNGNIKRERVLPVNVPAGADDGQSITYYNEGEAGKNGGANGSLVIKLKVKPHQLFERHGYDLYMAMPISFVDATMGAKLKVPTTKTPITYTVPPGTQSGTRFRLKGYGVKFLNKSQYGDLYVTVTVETPVKLNRKQEALLEEFKNSLDDKQSEQTNSFSKKWFNE